MGTGKQQRWACQADKLQLWGHRQRGTNLISGRRFPALVPPEAASERSWELACRPARGEPMSLTVLTGLSRGSGQKTGSLPAVAGMQIRRGDLLNLTSGGTLSKGLQRALRWSAKMMGLVN